MDNKVRISSGSNLPRVRAQNLTVVLDALRKLQPISRSDLAAATNLTPATMTNLVAELINRGFICEERSLEKQIGRRPTLLSLDPNRATILGIEISRSQVLGIVTDVSGSIRQSVQRAAPARAGQVATLSIVQEVIELLWDENLPPVGIGVGVPGPVDSSRGWVLEPPNFPGWHKVPLSQVLSDRWKVPVLIDDDAKTAALGEHWFGNGQSVNTMLYISIGEGVGAGLIVRDELYRGTHELAGEMGHTTLDLDGPVCECGNRGCLETFVSTGAIRNRAHSLSVNGGDVLQTIESLARKKNRQAIEVKDVTYRYLAAGVINAVNFYDPDLIIVGGPLVDAWNDLCEQLGQRVRGRSFGLASESIEIQSSELGRYASVVGAAVLVIQHFFQNPQVLGNRFDADSEISGLTLPR